VLAEVVNGPGNAVVLAIGLNVMPLPDDVPAGAGGLPATSLAEQHAITTDRTVLAIALLGVLAKRWRAGGGCWRSGRVRAVRCLS